MNALRISARKGSAQAVSSFNASRAAFSMSARAMASKEDSLHSEGRAQEIDEHKQDSLKKKDEGKGHWKDELASNSESIIKAERGEVDASHDTIKKLQDESAKVAKQKA